MRRSSAASVEPSKEMRDIARLCASAIGADIFGFDMVYSDGVPYVVDLSSFPGFKDVPDAPQLLADAIAAAAPRAERLDRGECTRWPPRVVM
jgi:ribosomal protein S6--L-glutamate ligase